MACVHDSMCDIKARVTVSTFSSSGYRLLTQADRCDSCAARAFVRAEFVTGSDEHQDAVVSSLLFCNHHYKKYKATIDELAVFVLDETEDALF